MKSFRVPEGIKTAAQKLGRLKYAAAVLLVGLALLLLPQNGEETADAGQTAEASQPAGTQDTVEALETRLSEELSRLDGAGETSVTLTMESGAETVYHSDETLRYEDGVLTEQTRQTVLYDDGGEAALVAQELGPVYRGALVLSQGADNAQVRLAIVEAVSALTGLGADQITVIKMKETD